MASIRTKKTRNFTVMSNHHLKDKNLSLRAKGLLSLMLSLPDEWEYSVAGLSRICADGTRSINSTIEELEEYGYITRQKIQLSDRQFPMYEYEIHEASIL